MSGQLELLFAVVAAEFFEAQKEGLVLVSGHVSHLLTDVESELLCLSFQTSREGEPEAQPGGGEFLCGIASPCQGALHWGRWYFPW